MRSDPFLQLAHYSALSIWLLHDSIRSSQSTRWLIFREDCLQALLRLTPEPLLYDAVLLKINVRIIVNILPPKLVLNHIIFNIIIVEDFLHFLSIYWFYFESWSLPLKIWFATSLREPKSFEERRILLENTDVIKLFSKNICSSAPLLQLISIFLAVISEPTVRCVPSSIFRHPRIVCIKQKPLAWPRLWLMLQSRQYFLIVKQIHLFLDLSRGFHSTFQISLWCGHKLPDLWILYKLVDYVWGVGRPLVFDVSFLLADHPRDIIWVI